MKSPYYARMWQTTTKVILVDPCFDNSVIGLSDKSFPLSVDVTFDTSSID